MKAYIYDDLPGDQRLPHDSGTEVSVQDLNDIGVLYYHLTTQEEVDELAKKRNYRNRDVVNISPSTMTPKVYEEKLAMFFSEHLHDDEEIRYILDGEGYFDVRDRKDRWVRCLVEKQDLLILPLGIYHRFSTTSSDYVKALRLFKDEPKWVAHNRPAEGESRELYLKQITA